MAILRKTQTVIPTWIIFYTAGFDKGLDLNTGFGLIKAYEAVGDVKLTIKIME
ncbi:MAG: hypothetical protein NVSMB7_09850 [Chitinophagaceae bacterium]